MAHDDHAKGLKEIDARVIAVLIDRILYHEVGEGILICDKGGRLLFANASARAMADISADRDISSLSVDDFGKRFFSDSGFPVPKEQWPMTRALSGEVIVGGEMSVQRQDGTYYDIIINGVPLLADDGTLYGAYSAYMDISKEKEHERELEQRQQLLSSVLDALPVGVVGFLSTGQIFFDNPARRRIWAQKEDEPKPVPDLKGWRRSSGEMVQFHEWPVHQVISTGKPQPEELFDIECFDGSRKTVALSAFPVKGRVGVLEAIGVIRDVTNEIETEEKVNRMQRELRRRVDDRTTELEDAYRELESFSYSVSHDLRAPLRNIYGYTQLLVRRYEDRIEEQAQEYLRRIQAGVEKMDRLIDDILRLSRVGRTELKQETVDLSAMAESIAQELRESRPERSGDFMIQPGLEATADSDLLHVALYNLLENAWKYTTKKEYAAIRFGKEDVEGKTAFYVRDNGAGFNMEQAERLFNPFQRLHPESEFGGTGIGLAIVKKIIQKHRGAVWARGEEGRGATFYFTLGNGER